MNLFVQCNNGYCSALVRLIIQVHQLCLQQQWLASSLVIMLSLSYGACLVVRLPIRRHLAFASAFFLETIRPKLFYFGVLPILFIGLVVQKFSSYMTSISILGPLCYTRSNVSYSTTNFPP